MFFAEAYSRANDVFPTPFAPPHTSSSAGSANLVLSFYDLNTTSHGTGRAGVVPKWVVIRDSSDHRLG
jgi:hypothetical protein